MSGRASANLAGNTVVAWAAKQNPLVKTTYTIKTGLVWAIPFRADDKAGRAQISMVVKCMKQDGSLAALHEKWFGSKPAAEEIIQKYGPAITATGSGLVATGSKLDGFVIAGDDKNFVPAEAIIAGNKVIVSSAQVKEPVYVRYAWANAPLGANLFNKEGLPAAPFRTDKD